MASGDGASTVEHNAEHNVADLLQTIEGLKAEKAEWTRQRKELEDEIVRLQEESQVADEVRKLAEQARQQQIGENSSVVKLSGKIRKLNGEKEGLIRQITELENEIVRLHEEREVANDLCMDAVDVSFHENSADTVHSDCHEQLTSLQADLASHQEENENLMGQIGRLESEQITIQANLGEALSHILIFREQSTPSSMNRDQLERLEMISACLSSLHDAQDRSPGPGRRSDSPGAVPPVRSEPPGENADMKCVICYVKDCSVEIKPCNHIVMCDTCAELQMSENGTCPVDRQAIESMTNIMEN
ncbi:myosin heavy chain, clone 203-like isoform X2 [Ptychodera flava]